MGKYNKSLLEQMNDIEVAAYRESGCEQDVVNDVTRDVENTTIDDIIDKIGAIVSDIGVEGALAPTESEIQLRFKEAELDNVEDGSEHLENSNFVEVVMIESTGGLQAQAIKSRAEVSSPNEIPPELNSQREDIPEFNQTA